MYAWVSIKSGLQSLCAPSAVVYNDVCLSDSLYPARVLLVCAALRY